MATIPYLLIWEGEETEFYLFSAEHLQLICKCNGKFINCSDNTKEDDDNLNALSELTENWETTDLADLSQKVIAGTFLSGCLP